MIVDRNVKAQKRTNINAETKYISFKTNILYSFPIATSYNSRGSAK